MYIRNMLRAVCRRLTCIAVGLVVAAEVEVLQSFDDLLSLASEVDCVLVSAMLCLDSAPASSMQAGALLPVLLFFVLKLHPISGVRTCSYELLVAQSQQYVVNFLRCTLR